MVTRNSALGIILFVVFASLSFGETTYYNADSIIVSEPEWNEIAKRWNEHIRQRSILISKPVNKPQNKNTTQSYNNAPEENSNISLPPPQATYNPVSLPPTPTTYNPISVTPSVPVNSVSAPVSQQPSVVKKLSKPVNLLPPSKGIDWGKVTGKAIAHTIAVAIICGIIALVTVLRKKKLPLGTIWKQKNSNSTLGKEHENMPEDEVVKENQTAAKRLEPSNTKVPEIVVPPSPISSNESTTQSGRGDQSTAVTATRSLNDILADAAALGVKGVDEAFKGLYKLFGGSALKSFPAGFDESSYRKAKPHFQAAFESFKASGKNLKEFFELFTDKFGAEIKPYLMRFMHDILSVKENTDSNVNSIKKETENGQNDRSVSVSGDIQRGKPGEARQGILASVEGGSSGIDRNVLTAESRSGQSGGKDELRSGLKQVAGQQAIGNSITSGTGDRIDLLFTVDDLIEKAKDQRQRGRYEEALISSIFATKSDPDNAEAWWQVALNRLSLGDAQNALPALKRTVKLAPYFSIGWARYGTALLETGDAVSAQEAFERSLKEDPDQEDALKALADIYYRQNKDKQKTVEIELSVLTRLEAVTGLSSGQLNRIGILHYQNKTFFEAIKYWERDVQLSANLFNLGLAYNSPEVSQVADAVDFWRLTAKRYPGYHQTQELIDSVLPKLLTLAKNAKPNSTLLQKDQWCSFYLNPFELLNSPEALKFDDFDAKTIQRLKKALSHEIKCEDGFISWMPGLHVDESKAISVCREMDDSKKRKFHYIVFKNKPLLNFLSYGSYAHFLVDKTSSPLETIELLKDQDNGFREWLSEPFAKQFDLVLSKAIDPKNLAVLECLLSGRRWVAPSYADKCFESARRRVDRLLEPMRNDHKLAADVMPTVESVTRLLEQEALVDILNLLPIYFRDLQNETFKIIRDLAMSCYNSHSNIDLSKNVLQIARRLVFKSTKLNQSLDDDFKQIEEIIRKERKYEAHLTSGGGDKWEITKEGITQGARFFPVNMIVSARWGIISDNHVKSYDYLFAVKNNKGAEIMFAWKTSTDIEKSEGYFSNFVDAALSYLLPSIVEKIDQRLKAGDTIQIGHCSITERGVQFETKGWILSKTHFVPWQRVHLVVENGELIVSDTSSSKVRTEMSHRLIDNAPILHFLAHHRNPD